jgi:hypothetical protein
MERKKKEASGALRLKSRNDMFLMAYLFPDLAM